MSSFFDQLDKRHRQPEPIRPEPMTLGQDCPDPKCRGRMLWTCCDVPFSCSCESRRLACDCCGWEQGEGA